jgi:hypothetical protein
MLSGGVSAFLIMSIFMFFSAKLGMTGNTSMAALTGGLGALATAVIFLTGLSATGILLMDQAKGNEIRTVSSAFFAGLITLPSIIGSILLFGLILVATYILLAVALFICKIPVLGPVLYVFVFPVSVVLLGGLFFSYVNVFAPLSMPAIWDGNGVMQVVAKLFALARTNLLPVIIFQILLLLIVGLISAVTFGTLVYGVLMVSPLSMMVLPSGGVDQLSGALFGMMIGAGASEGAGYMLAAGIGGAILFMTASAVPMLTLLMGNCIIYLNFVREQDTEQFEATVRSKVNEFKDKAAEARSQLAQQPITAQAVPILNASSCPKCSQTVASDELFCGNCGCKLN